MDTRGAAIPTRVRGSESRGLLDDRHPELSDLVLSHEIVLLVGRNGQLQEGSRLDLQPVIASRARPRQGSHGKSQQAAGRGDWRGEPGLAQRGGVSRAGANRDTKESIDNRFKASIR